MIGAEPCRSTEASTVTLCNSYGFPRYWAPAACSRRHCYIVTLCHRNGHRPPFTRWKKIDPWNCLQQERRRIVAMANEEPNGRRHRRRRHRRADARPAPASGRHSLPHLRGRAGDQAARRRHQSAAACQQGTDRARPAGCARQGRDHHHQDRLLQPLRPVDLQRPVRALRRLRMADVLDPPRRPADGAARGVHRARRRRSRRDQPPLHRSRAGR